MARHKSLAPESEIPIDPIEAAKAAKLRYVSDEDPGIRRKRSGKGFSYIDADGKTIHDEQTLARIKALAIPPAWTDVWICTSPNGHIQATGRDAKGRKQYRYHARWRQTRNNTKFDLIAKFGHCLPTIRKVTDKHLRQHELTREKVLATVVRLLETTLIRIGNAEYARDNESFGLTTMHDEHVTVEGAKVHFEFRGKSGIDHTIDMKDKRLARIVKACRDLDGYDLFQYSDANGGQHSIGSADVNAYLREITGEDFTAKNFRTWGGSVMALQALVQMPPPENETQGKKNVVEAIKAVAAHLGNTAAVCRSYYVHPAVIDAYMKGTLRDVVEAQSGPPSVYDLRPEESALLALISG
jgi:DNA topoisomerase I